MTDSRPVTDSLAITALDTERYVAAGGWDQNPRLFALVDTAELMEREPQLREQMTGPDLMPGALTAVEQDDLPPTNPLESFLGRLSWPEAVLGVALAVERIVVPPEAERDLPEEPDKAIAALAEHRERRDVRLLAAVHRDGRSICLLRQRAHDSDDRVAMGDDIAPGLVHALRATLRD
ncbi:PPA1309 family protein [Actinomycetota bacterium]